MLQDSVASDRRPLSWVVDDSGVSQVGKDKAEVASQRDLRTPNRMKATELAQPNTIGSAPLSGDLLGGKTKKD